MNSARMRAIGCRALLLKTIPAPSGVHPTTVLAAPRYVTRLAGPPSDGMQYFGLAKIDGATRVLTVSLNDVTGKTLYSVDVKPT